MGKLGSRLRCDEHDCPMIEVDGTYYCVVEYLDAHLGGSQIKDIVPGDHEVQPTAPTCLVFTDGHTLPILCPDCGEGHSLGMDADEFLEDVTGLYLIGFSYLPPEDDEPEGIELILSEDPDLDPNEADDDNSDTLFVHLLSVQQLTCPDGGATDMRGANNMRRAKGPRSSEDSPGPEDPSGPEDGPG